MTLKLYDRIQNCYLSSYAVLVSNVPELQARRIACLLKAVTPAWVTNTVPFLLVIDYIHRSGSFEVLQAKVNCHFSARPASPVAPALNKHYFTRGGLIIVSFMYFTWCW